MCWASPITTLTPLLAAIRTGQLALVTRPPPPSEREAGAEWVADQFTLAELDGARLLDECRKRIDRRWPNHNPKTRDELVNSEVAQCVRVLQEQPGLMSHYRRFVIIHAESMTDPPRDLKVKNYLPLKNWSG